MNVHFKKYVSYNMLVVRKSSAKRKMMSYSAGQGSSIQTCTKFCNKYSAINYLMYNISDGNWIHLI
jgi:hypothetical protein